MAEILTKVKYDIFGAKLLMTHYDTELQGTVDTPLDTSVRDKLNELFAVTDSPDYSWSEEVEVDEQTGRTQLVFKRNFSPS